jgi:ribose transport system substrate-binding protein
MSDNKRILFVVISLLIVMAFVFSACTQSQVEAPVEEAAAPEEAAPEEEAEMEEEGPITVAFSQAAMENEARVQIQLDLERAVTDQGWEFIWANAAGDPAKQLSDVEDLLAKKPDYLVLAPVESEPLATVPDKAEAAGVPLIVIDREIPGTPGEGAWIVLLTNDFREAGRVLFQDMVDTVEAEFGEPKAKVVHITGQTGASPVIDEQAGIDDVLVNYPDVEIIATCDGRYAAEPSRKCMEDLLQRFPAGEIDVVFADSDTIGLGALEAVRTAGRDELLNWIWGRDGSVPWLEEMVEMQVASTYQTIIFYGDQVVEVIKTHQQTGQPIDPPVSYATGEFFHNHDQAGIDRAKERIEELNELGLGCCFAR